MSSKNINFLVSTFYSFSPVNSPEILAKEIKSYCTSLKLRGSIILSHEGINGTLAGYPQSIEKILDYFNKREFHNLNSKFSESADMPFYRMKVKIKKEIIGMLNGPIDTQAERGMPIDPKEWNDVMAQEDIILIDTRNEYETSIGTFQNAIIPPLKSFKDFKAYIDTELLQYKDKKIAMFCTGGIRCEKASYYMKQIGFSEVFQLNGGILKYLEEIPLNESKWTGECFVFDERVTVNSKLEKGTFELCRGCKSPLSFDDKKLPGYEKDVSCSKCFKSTSDFKKNNFRERSRQIKLAKAKGIQSVYITGSIEEHIP